MPHKYLDYLRLDIEKKLGHKITNAKECELLSEEIKTSTKHIVSSQTFRRFFGIINYSGGYNKQLLNILSNFCGHENFDQYTQQLVAVQFADCFQETENYNPKSLWEQSEMLCTKIATSSQLLVETHYKLLKYPLARQFFMEHHPMRDLLSTVYSQYFLEYLKYKDTTEAQLFAYSFLYNAAYLSENEELKDLYYQKLISLKPTPEVFVLPAARYFGIQLLHADSLGNDKLFNEIWEKMLIARLQYKTASEHSVCSFEYIILEELIFTNRVQEMQFLIENHTDQKYQDRNFIPEEIKINHQQVWKILCAIVYHKTAQTEKLELILSEIDLTKLTIGWKDYYSILYHLILFSNNQSLGTEQIKTIENLLKGKNFTYLENKFHLIKNNKLVLNN